MENHALQVCLTKFRELENSQGFSLVLVDLLDHLETGAQSQTERLEERICSLAINRFRAPCSNAFEIDVFRLRGFLSSPIQKRPLRMQYFVASFVMAEYFKSNRGLSGLQFNKDLHRCRVSHGDRAQPNNISNLLNSPASCDLPGLARQFKIGHTRQRGNVCYVMVVDEKVPRVKCLFEKLALEGRFIGIDKRMQACGGLQRMVDRRPRQRPVALVGERICWQRNPFSRVKRNSLPVREQALNPKPGNFVRIPSLQ